MFTVMVANEHLPAVTAQDAGRAVYHGRAELVQIVGDRDVLKKIAWIFHRVPDMFDIQFQYSSLIVRRTNTPDAPHYQINKHRGLLPWAGDTLAQRHAYGWPTYAVLAENQKALPAMTEIPILCKS